VVIILWLLFCDYYSVLIILSQTPGAAGPVALGARTVKAVACGNAHTCVILDDNTTRCWGYSRSGALVSAVINFTKRWRDATSVTPATAATATTSGD
jgi:alpha-tubulin suppressor-like RCC1 family protein